MMHHSQMSDMYGDYAMHEAPVLDCEYDDDAEMSGSARKSLGDARSIHKSSKADSSDDERSGKKKKHKKKKKSKTNRPSGGKSADKKKHQKKQDYKGRRVSGRVKGSASTKKKRKHSDSSSSGSSSSDSSEEQIDDDDMDFPLNCKRLGGVWLHADDTGYPKLVYPEKSKQRIIRQSPGDVPQELLDSFNGGSMTSEIIDQLIFILSGCGPNTRLNRFMHVGTEKDRKRKHFKAKMLQQAQRLGQLSMPPVPTRLELLKNMTPPGPSTDTHEP